MGRVKGTEKTHHFFRSGFDFNPVHHLKKGSCTGYDICVKDILQSHRGSNKAVLSGGFTFHP